MADKSKNRGASPNKDSSSSAPTVAEDTSKCEVSGGPIGGDGIGKRVVEEMWDDFGPVTTHVLVAPGLPCPGCEMEERMEKLEATANRWMDEKPRLLEVLFDLADRQLKPFVEDTGLDLRDLRALGLVDRIYAASYECQEGWQLLGPGKKMVHRRRVRGVAPSAEDFMANRIETGIPELDGVLAGGIPPGKIAEVWGTAVGRSKIEAALTILPMVSMLKMLVCMKLDIPYPHTHLLETDLIEVGLAEKINGKTSPTLSGEKAIAVFFGDRKNG